MRTLIVAFLIIICIPILGISTEWEIPNKFKSNDPIMAEKFNENYEAIEKKVSELKEATVPTGIIVMWSGLINSIPNGWALCDGTKGTPDLRDRFIMATVTSVSESERIGGRSKLVLELDNIPEHDHSIKHGHGHNLSISPQSHNHKYKRTRTDPKGTYYEENHMASGRDRGLWTGDDVKTDEIKLRIAGSIEECKEKSGKAGLDTPKPINIVPKFYKLAFIMKIS